MGDAILRHTGGDFVDAPGIVFPVSLGDTVLFATAVCALLLVFGPHL